MTKAAGGSPLRHGSHIGDPTEHDGAYGDWTKETLIAMDAAFRERLARALKRGLETTDGAIGVANGR